MSHRLFVLSLSFVLLLTGCRSQAPAFLPVTSGDNVSVPTKAEQARKNVLGYVLSARLTNMPMDADWQMEAGQKTEHQYRFKNSDWHILVWLTDTDDGNQHVVILDPKGTACWAGYVKSDGTVVDTSYIR